MNSNLYKSVMYTAFQYMIFLRLKKKLYTNGKIVLIISYFSHFLKEYLLLTAVVVSHSGIAYQINEPAKF